MSLAHKDQGLQVALSVNGELVGLMIKLVYFETSLLIIMHLISSCFIIYFKFLTS